MNNYFTYYISKNIHKLMTISKILPNTGKFILEQGKNYTFTMTKSPVMNIPPGNYFIRNEYKTYFNLYYSNKFCCKKFIQTTKKIEKKSIDVSEMFNNMNIPYLKRK